MIEYLPIITKLQYFMPPTLIFKSTHTYMNTPCNKYNLYISVMFKLKR